MATSGKERQPLLLRPTGDAHGHGHGSNDIDTSAPSVGIAGQIERYFKVRERGTTIKTEIRAGLVTFVTMSYILLVNPQVLTVAGTDATGGEFPFSSLVTSTALSAALGSIVVGLIGNLPFGLAPGMGLNSYFAYGICLHYGLSWHIGLTCVFVEGVLFMLLAASGACAMIQNYAPACIKKSITVGLGVFQALLGFEACKFVVRGDHVLLALGPVDDPTLWLALAGIIMIAVLMILQIRAAMLAGVVFVTLTAWATDMSPWPSTVVQSPTLHSTFFVLDFAGYFEHASTTIPCTLVFLFVSVFDAAGVMFAAGQQAKLLDDHHVLPSATQGFFSAGLATTIGALFGTSPVIVQNETCAGIHDGGRTGLTAITVGVCFLIALPFAPLLQAMPAVASAPPLIVVGVLMMACAKFIDWEQLDEAVPAFVVVTLLPFTYSIANGMLFGIGTWIMIKSGAALVSWSLNKHVTSVPVLAEDKSGVIDPVPGLPATHFVYHGQGEHPHDGTATDDHHIHHAVVATHAGGYGATIGAGSYGSGSGSFISDSEDDRRVGVSSGGAAHGTPNRRPVVRPRRGLSALSAHTPAAAYDEHL